ncbi:hypothetical protein [Cryobacterium sp. Hz9]|uniref:hypothetical protein n=1 Tax=Cryobacterium sp. Hz9 TaxID=1259167 RepID=UPI00106C966E|nr:hypothetical protein [Cryobacterium sp. Hz9]TFB71675.1 hypothetical protein E3N85_00545 [Cryobacterium sp. Hz9]
MTETTQDDVFLGGGHISLDLHAFGGQKPGISLKFYAALAMWASLTSLSMGRLVFRASLAKWG